MDSATRHSSSSLIPALLATLLLVMWALPFSAFMADDLIQLGFLRGLLPWEGEGPLRLYTLSDGVLEHVAAMKQTGAFPWFFELDFEMDFLRPLSSALLWADHTLFDTRAIGYVAHHGLWLLLAVLGAGLVFRRSLPPGLVGLATLIYALSPAHQGLSWTATRHVTIAAALGFLALAAHIRWRRDSWRPGALLAPLGIALSMTASEASLGVLGFLLAWELLEGPRKNRNIALIPSSILLIIYLGIYLLGDFGSHSSGYLDPLRQPLDYLLALPGRLLFLTGAMMGGGSADLWVLRPATRPLMIAAAALILALLAALLRFAHKRGALGERPRLSWWVLGTTLSALPFLGTPIGARCLVIPTLGASAILATLVGSWWTELRPLKGPSYRVFGLFCGPLAFLHLVLAPVQRLGSPPLLRLTMSDRVEEANARAELGDDLEGKRVIVLRAPDLFVGFHSSFYRQLHGLPSPQAWWTLSWGSCPHQFLQKAPQSFVMSLDGCAIGMDQVTLGQQVTLQGLKATVLDTSPQGGATKVLFELDRPLKDPSLIFLRWEDGRLARMRAPAQDGEGFEPWKADHGQDILELLSFFVDQEPERARLLERAQEEAQRVERALTIVGPAEGVKDAILRQIALNLADKKRFSKEVAPLPMTASEIERMVIDWEAFKMEATVTSGVHPRRYFGYVDEKADTAAWERRLLLAAQASVKAINAYQADRGAPLRITDLEVITTWLAEGGALYMLKAPERLDTLHPVFDVGLDDIASGFDELPGCQERVDREVGTHLGELVAWTREPPGSAVESSLSDSEIWLKHGKGEAGPFPYLKRSMNLEESVAGTALMWLWEKSIAARKIEREGLAPLYTRPADEQFVIGSLVYNSGILHEPATWAAILELRTGEKIWRSSEDNADRRPRLPVLPPLAMLNMLRAGGEYLDQQTWWLAQYHVLQRYGGYLGLLRYSGRFSAEGRLVTRSDPG